MGARPHCLDEPSWQKQNRSTRPTATVSKTAAATLLTASRRASRFLIREFTEAHPVVNLSLFTRRNFTVGALALALGYGTFFGNAVLLPLWLQQSARV